MGRSARTLALAAAISAIAGAAPAMALTGVTGGTAAPGASPGPVLASSGGSGTSADVRLSTAPLVSRVSFPATASAGTPPAVSFEVLEAGVGTVDATVVISNLTTGKAAASAALGWVHTGRVNRARWPRGAHLSAGVYEVSVDVRDHRGVRASSAAAARASHLTVTAPPAPAAAQPSAPAAGAPGVPTPAQTAADGAVFPVAGPHNFGGPENRYGAPRGNHIHEGQDVLTAEGTPVVVPLAGSITWTSYQAEGAGYYAVEHTSTGLDFMFAHCQANTLAVSAGQDVRAGQTLCHAGQTGDASAPHLHFEIWVGGWQAPGGHSIDPLPYLQAWEH